MLRLYDPDTARKTILRRSDGPVHIAEYPPALLESTERLFGPGITPPKAVEHILASVQEEGDPALRHWSELLDNIRLSDFRIPPDELAAAWTSLPESLTQALTTASERVRAFHERQPLPDWQTAALGGIVGQRVTPIGTVGIYVPGGTAPLPSSTSHLPPPRSAFVQAALSTLTSTPS